MNVLKELNKKSKNLKVKVKILEKRGECNIRVKKDNLIHFMIDFLISDKKNKFLLSMWDEEIDKIPLGETIIINNGYVSQHAGDLLGGCYI